MQHPVTNDVTSDVTGDSQPATRRTWTRNAPLALILAGGLAAGLGLARPASTDAGATVAAGDAAPAATASDQNGNPDDAYRQGNRQAGERQGAQPAAPADGAAQATGEAGQTANATITIEGFAFRGPAVVAPGTTLTVTNADGAPHTLTFRNGEGDTGTIEGGGTATLTAPTEPGTYAFFCAIHPSMEGEIQITG